ncbi:MAG TPA: cysteine desulfurase family protein [Methylocella sp.]|nr:cysteine desulfurase family protein [Methylocella sp.]
MSRTRVYLDHNATAPLHPAARASMGEAFDLCGNASSVHAEGRAARDVIEAARAEVAAFAGTAPKNVVFTSGGTEALNLALTPHIATPGDSLRPFDLLLAGAGEHPAVLAGHRFAPEQLDLIGLTASGELDLRALGEAIARASAAGRHIMLALQAANNETGVRQPVAVVADLVHAAGGLLVCDAVQAAGKVPCDLGSLGVDAIVLSAHKFGGPKGAGALCFGSGSYHIKDVLLRGGGQERGLRAGTENIAAIAGMAAALAAAKVRREEQAKVLSLWRDEMETEIARALPGVVFFGAGVERLPNTSCFAMPTTDAQVLLIALDMEGFAVSSGSACSSGKVKRSHVLSAMGVEPELAMGAIRVSLGWNSRREDCVSFVQALERTVRTIRARRDKPAA